MYDAEKNVLMLGRAREGDGEALRQVCENNMGLVRTVAFAFRERGTELEDLIQIGTIGLIKAIRGYDPSYGTVFSTYAVPLIMGEIKKFIRDDGPVKVSRRIKHDARMILHFREKYASANDGEPTVQEICEQCGLSEEDAVTALDAASPLLSFDAEYGDTSLENLVGSDNIEKMLDKMALRQAVNALEPTERRIILLRYFRSMTQTKVAQMLGVSQVKISRCEKKAIEHLRDALTECRRSSHS
ncbi:MAG TPA: sigma-70 family RNA polymerase sigma factor [Bacillota bacterium]|nr:sigma-70 family RNA polymerase sigma factor [Bacillota bacterium]